MGHRWHTLACLGDPACDPTHSPGPGGEHTSTIPGEGRQPTRGHGLKLAAQFGLKPRGTSE